MSFRTIFSPMTLWPDLLEMALVSLVEAMIQNLVKLVQY